jgi:hypothetical protein
MAYAYIDSREDLAIQDQVLVETVLAGQDTRLQAVIVRLAETELWLGLVSAEAGLENLLRGQDVRLSVTHRGEVLLGPSQFLRLLDTGSSP